MLRALWWCMAVFGECSVNIITHGNVNVFLVIVPPQIHTAIAAAGPVDDALVVCLDGCNEVVYVGPIEVFNSEVIYTDGERCPSVSVLPNSGGVA